MIELTTGQPCLLDPQYVVVTGGTYLPGDLVEVKNVDFEDQRAAFQAQYIATGESA